MIYQYNWNKLILLKNQIHTATTNIFIYRQTSWYQIFKLEGQGKPVVPKVFTDRSWHTDLQFYYSGTEKSICNISTIMSKVKVEIIKIHALYFRSCKEGVEKYPRWKEKGRKWKKKSIDRKTKWQEGQEM